MDPPTHPSSPSKYFLSQFVHQPGLVACSRPVTVCRWRVPVRRHFVACIIPSTYTDCITPSCRCKMHNTGSSAGYTVSVIVLQCYTASGNIRTVALLTNVTASKQTSHIVQLRSCQNAMCVMCLPDPRPITACGG